MVDKLDILGNLTFEEMKLMGKIMSAPERSSFVDGESGGVITSLLKKEIVEKVLRVGRVWKWRIKEEYQSKDARDFVKERLILVDMK